jgi:type III secretion system FlhB-like substrate exporter
MSDANTIKIYLPYPQLAEGSLLELKPEHWDDESIKILLLELTKAFSDLGRRQPDRSLAEMISAVLMHPELPEPILNEVQEALCTLYNDAEREDIDDFERSPAYVDNLISSFARKQEREADEAREAAEADRKLADDLAAVMNNPSTPDRIYNVLADELTYIQPDYTPEIVAAAIDDIRSKEDQDKNSES